MIKGPCYYTKNLCYFRQLPDGQFLVGGFRNLDIEGERTYADQITPVIQDALYDFIQNHFPGGNNVEIESQWSGTMAFTDDGQMILGPAKKTARVQILSGCGGHGMGLYFNAAKILVESLRDPHGIPERLRVSRYFQ